MRCFALPTVILFVGICVVAACEEQDHYVYTARTYDPNAGCLEPYRAVEVVQGSEVSATCDPICMTVDGKVLVSSICPPLPAVAQELATDSPECLAARDASRLEASCGASVASDANADASTDSPAQDATLDAPADADHDGATDGAPRDANLLDAREGG